MNTTDIPNTAGACPALALDACSLPVSSAEALLDRADRMLRNADVMLDGWQAARDWCNDLIYYRRELEAANVRQPEENIGHEPTAPRATENK